MPALQFTTQLAAARKYLQAHKQDSGWPYQPGHAASIEASSWCYLALRQQSQSLEQARTFFQHKQNSDGGWSTQSNLAGSDWTSSLALLALRILHQDADSLLKQPCFEQGVKWLLNNQHDSLSFLTKSVLVLMNGPEVLENYPSAWPWTPSTYYWVEPTSYALLILKPLADKLNAQAAIDKGNHFLLLHGCQAGGWNSGNNVSLGVQQPPTLATTALALLALQDSPKETSVQHGLRYLQNVADQQFSVMSLSWLVLAGHAYGLDISQSLQSLSKLQRQDGSFGQSLHLTGMAMCALDTVHSGNPFKF